MWVFLNWWALNGMFFWSKTLSGYTNNAHVATCWLYYLFKIQSYFPVHRAKPNTHLHKSRDFISNFTYSHKVYFSNGVDTVESLKKYFCNAIMNSKNHEGSGDLEGYMFCPGVNTRMLWPLFKTNICRKQTLNAQRIISTFLPVNSKQNIFWEKWHFDKSSFEGTLTKILN